MIDKICTFLTKRIQKEMPEIDEERAEVINFGLQNIIGEIPKTFLLFIIAFFLGMLKEVLFLFIVLIPYRSSSGGFHLRTHLGCILGTAIFYCGTVILSKIIVLGFITKCILIAIIWIFGMVLIKMYAPADTENIPILSKKDRRKKQIIAFATFTIGMLAALIINNSLISNILIFGNLFQTLTITKIAYKLTNNKYGYEVYNEVSA